MLRVLVFLAHAPPPPPHFARATCVAALQGASPSARLFHKGSRICAHLRTHACVYMWGAAYMEEWNNVHHGAHIHDTAARIWDVEFSWKASVRNKRAHPWLPCGRIKKHILGASLPDINRTHTDSRWKDLEHFPGGLHGREFSHGFIFCWPWIFRWIFHWIFLGSGMLLIYNQNAPKKIPEKIRPKIHGRIHDSNPDIKSD